MTFQLLLHAVPATSLPVSAIPWAAISRLTLACSPCAFRVHYPVTSIILTLHAALATVAARLLRGHASAALQWRPVATSSSARRSSAHDDVFDPKYPGI
jgi:hypothetical protein